MRYLVLAALCLALLPGCGDRVMKPEEVPREGPRYYSRKKLEDYKNAKPRKGFTKGMVRAALGEPDGRRSFTTTTGASAEIWDYVHSHYTLEFVDGLVSRVWDNSIERTRRELD